MLRSSGSLKRVGSLVSHQPRRFPPKRARRGARWGGPGLVVPPSVRRRNIKSMGAPSGHPVPPVAQLRGLRGLAPAGRPVSRAALPVGRSRSRRRWGWRRPVLRPPRVPPPPRPGAAGRLACRRAVPPVGAGPVLPRRPPLRRGRARSPAGSPRRGLGPRVGWSCRSVSGGLVRLAGGGPARLRPPGAPCPPRAGSPSPGPCRAAPLSGGPPRLLPRGARQGRPGAALLCRAAPPSFWGWFWSWFRPGSSSWWRVVVAPWGRGPYQTSPQPSRVKTSGRSRP